MASTAAGYPQRPSLLCISTPAPAQPIPSSSSQQHNPSKSPFRYVHFQDLQQKSDPLALAPTALAPTPQRPSIDHPLSGQSPNPDTSEGVSTPSSSAPRTQPPRKLDLPHPSPHSPRPIFPPLPLQCRERPQGIRIPDRLKPWLGVGSWVVTSIGFLLAIAFWKNEVFTALDQLALQLQSLGSLGYLILFSLIFITTIPPFPLYSTLIILSGYTFGTWIGAVISYTAALTGAVAVFLLSRHYLRDCMSRHLSHTASLKRVVRAIEKRPSLLLLIRIAPYPYNLMNVLLASSHTLPFSTYFTCTALSLVKVVIHTSVGSGIHSFAGYHAVVPDGMTGDEEGLTGSGRKNGLAQAWTVSGIVLCFAILVYLAYVARRAVDEELEDEGMARAEEGEGGDRYRTLEEMREVGS